MLRKANGLLMAFAVCWMLWGVSGCPAPPPPIDDNDNAGNDNTSNDNAGNDNAVNDNTANDNDNDNGGGDADLVSVVNSGIAIHVGARIEVGDDVIAYTYPLPAGNPGGVDYMIPSAGDTAGRGIPGGENYDADSFAVCGKKIALVGSNTTDMAFQVAIYDTETPSVDPVLIPDTDIRLGTIPVGNSDPGHIQGDGHYVVTRNSSSPIVRVIDVSGSTPEIIPLAVDPGGASSVFAVPQVLVDAETETVVAVSGDSFFVYDIANPAAAPIEFPVAEGFDDGFQYKMDSGVILFGDNQAYNAMYLLDVTDPANQPVVLSVGEGFDPEVFDGYYGFLTHEGPSSAFSASAIGAVDDATPTVAPDVTIAEGTANLGMFGQGGSIAMGISGDDVLWFVAGPLQWSTGGGVWNVVYDPADLNSPLAASNVVTNGNGTLLGFRWGSEANVLGYAIIDGD